MSDLKPEEHPKGSFYLVLIFFVVFLVLYVLNWKFLTEIWRVG